MTELPPGFQSPNRVEEEEYEEFRVYLSIFPSYEVEAEDEDYAIDRALDWCHQEWSGYAEVRYDDLEIL